MAFIGCVCLGKWRRAFQPEKTSLQDFYLDESTTIKLPLMTQTGRFHYLNDKVTFRPGDLFYSMYSACLCED